jgi:hypothetical protein
MLFFGPVTYITRGLFNTNFRIQQRKQQKTMHFGDLILSSSHLETLGEILMA